MISYQGREVVTGGTGHSGWELKQAPLRALSKRADFYTHTHIHTHTHILSLSKGMSVSLSSEQKLKQALLKALSKRADFYTHRHRHTHTHTHTHTLLSLSLKGNICQLSSEQKLKQAPLKALSKRADFYKHTHTNTHILSLSLSQRECLSALALSKSLPWESTGLYLTGVGVLYYYLYCWGVPSQEISLTVFFRVLCIIFNILSIISYQKTKIMASGPITSLQIDGETVEIVTDFIFLGFRITSDGDCSHEIKRCLLLWRKAVTNLDSILKSRDMTLTEKGLSSQSYGFSSCHVWLWELDRKESWMPKNWFFWTVVLEKTLESPLDCKEIKLVNPKGNQFWIFIERIDAEAPILWPPDSMNWLIWIDPDAGKDWRQEEKGMTEDEVIGWYHRLDGHQFE